MGGGGVKPKHLSEEHEGVVLGVVDEMEKYNRKLIANPDLMRERSFYPAPLDLDNSVRV